MKTSQVLKILVLVTVLGTAGILYGNHRAKVAKSEAEITVLRSEAKEAFGKMLEIYEKRLDLLREVDSATATQIRKQITSLDLETQEGTDQFDYFQTLVSEKFSTWMTSPAAKKSPVVAKLKELEIQLVRKRAESHRLASEVNEKIALLDSPAKKIAVFKAEAMLQQMTQSHPH